MATGVALGFIGVTLGIVSRLSGPIDLASTPALSRVIFAIAVSLIGWALSRLPGRGTVGRPVLWSAYIAMAVVFSLNEWFLML